MSSKRNFIAFICGRKGSGKSYQLDRLGKKFPRRLILDFLGEYEDAIPGALETWSLAETARALQEVKKLPSWTVVSSMDENEVPELLEVLAPSWHGGAPGYSRTVGGMVLQMGECDSILPNSGGSVQARGIFKRGRHHSLSILAGTQRPAETSRIVTAMADMVCSFRQHEPRDLAYLSSVMGGARTVPLLVSLPAYTHLRYWTANGVLERVAPDGSSSRV